MRSKVGDLHAVESDPQRQQLKRLLGHMDALGRELRMADVADQDLRHQLNTLRGYLITARGDTRDVMDAREQELLERR